MSTRCTIHLHSRGSTEPTAIVYRHSDGYPGAILPDLDQFFSDVESQTKDTRFNDPSYLAAKFVVWQANRYAYHYDFSREGAVRKKSAMLDFLSVGIVMRDPGDIEFRYHIWCRDDNRPRVTHEKT